MTCSTSLSFIIKKLKNVSKFYPIPVYLTTIFQISSCNESLVTAVNIKLNEKIAGQPFCSLPFYKKKIILTVYAYISKIYYHAPFYDPILSSSSVVPNSEVHTSILN
jgi:hypothetical protein